MAGPPGSRSRSRPRWADRSRSRHRETARARRSRGYGPRSARRTSRASASRSVRSARSTSDSIGPIQVADGSVHPRGQRGPREAGTDALGDLARRGSCSDFADASVGQGHRIDALTGRPISSPAGGATGRLEGANQKKSAIPARISAATASQRPISGPRGAERESFIGGPSWRTNSLRKGHETINLTASRNLS